ncbi:hypothetical protein LINPERHAP2_LOCUS10665 [Linum perenne]
MMLLIVTTMVTVPDESGCSEAGLVASGACKDDYADCVSKVLTQLRDRTPYTEDKTFSTYYPPDATTGDGVVSGYAACVKGSSFNDCQSCLFAAKDWLDQNCPSSAVGTYEGICVMKDRTPYMERESFSTHYPADESYGVVSGFAACFQGHGFDACKSCIYAAKDWLDQNCPSSAVGNYAEGICVMTYSQHFE